MNDGTIRDVEDPAHWDGQKSKVSELGVFLEVVVGISANKGGSAFEPSETLKGR